MQVVLNMIAIKNFASEVVLLDNKAILQRVNNGFDANHLVQSNYFDFTKITGSTNDTQRLKTAILQLLHL